MPLPLLLVVAGSLWHPQACDHITPLSASVCTSLSPLCVSLCPFMHLMRTLPLDLGPILIQEDLILILNYICKDYFK